MISVVPGPDMMFIMATGITGGRRAGVVSALGVSAGLTVHTVAAAFGLGALLRAAPFVLDTVRWLGAAFLLYLAVTAFRSARRPSTEDTRPVRARSLRRTFGMAALTNLANPKVILFYLAFFPQFLDQRAAWPVTVQFLVLGAMLVVIGFVVDASTGFASGALSETLRRRPAVRGWLDRISATVFAALAVRLVVSGHGT
ncbi:LysE family translocator [Amycolatopsis sp. CA-230715]|uniref:LysE family translocator n=1 Tax=Amycolatopsis sp. CA-230715 TaxID=2745196 RepID=UPI0021115855|nr:LysE family translocator [Amycolatopsis sp. CA-230715]